MELIRLLESALELNASDIFIIAGSPATAKVRGDLVPLSDEKVMPADAQQLIHDTYRLANDRDMMDLIDNGDDDFSFSLVKKSRFRCNVYRQRGTLAATYRVVRFGLPDPDAIGIPPLVIELANTLNGMILVTGPAGSGKSTTLACMVDKINSTRGGHIITIEDPIEYLHPHKKSLVSQREVPSDALDFERALRGALRQAPDVIMLGEMRDNETMSIAMTAAETGHLLLSSLHTVGAAKTIDRIIDTFPANQQAQIRIQLSMILRAVISQRLVPAIGGGQIPVFEVMTVTPAVQNMIRDGKTHQIDNVIYGGGMDKSMMSMDNELLKLYKQKKITRETAIAYATNPDMLRKRII